VPPTVLDPVPTLDEPVFAPGTVFVPVAFVPVAFVPVAFVPVVPVFVFVEPVLALLFWKLELPTLG